MKNQIIIKHFFALAVLLSVFAFNGYADEKKIRLSSSDYPPYFGETLSNQGFLTEIIVEAFKSAGYTTEITFRPWARALEEAKLGQYEGMFALWHRKEREEWFLFSDPLPPNEIGFYKRAEDKIVFSTFEDLKPYKIGICRGYANPPEFEKATYLMKEEVTDDNQNLMKLFHRRIDLALIDKGLAKYIIETKHPDYKDKLEWLEPAIEKVFQHLVLSKKAKDPQKKMEDFNLGLKTITENGMLEKILEKHGY